MTFIRLFIIAAIVLFAGTLWAARDMSGESFPYSLSLDSENYSDALWTSNGGTHTWRNGTSYCWSGGCAEFTPPTTQGGYSALGQFLNLSGHGFTRYSVRWLEYWGGTYVENTINCKVLITETTTTARPSVFDGEVDSNTFFSVVATDGTVQNWPDCTGDIYHICEDVQFKMGYSYREAEWIAFELVVDLRNAGDPSSKLYVTTQDGAFIEQLISDADITSTGGYFDYIDFLGTYCDAGGGTASTTDPNNFYRIDEVVINGTTDGSSPYIGPPDGFLSGTTPNPVITGIPIIKGVTIR